MWSHGKPWRTVVPPSWFHLETRDHPFSTTMSVSCRLWSSQRKGYLWERKGDSPQTPGNSPKEGSHCHCQDLGDGHTSTVKRTLTWPQKHLWHCKCFTQILGFLLPFSYTLFQLLLQKKSPPNLSGLRQEPSFILLLILQLGQGTAWEAHPGSVQRQAGASTRRSTSRKAHSHGWQTRAGCQ